MNISERTATCDIIDLIFGAGVGRKYPCIKYK